MKYLYVRCDNCKQNLPCFWYCFIEAADDGAAYSVGYTTLQETHPLADDHYMVNDLCVRLSEDVPVRAIAALSACESVPTERLTPSLVVMLHHENKELKSQIKALSQIPTNRDLHARLLEAIAEIKARDDQDDEPWLEETQLLLDRTAPTEQKSEPYALSFWHARNA